MAVSMDRAISREVEIEGRTFIATFAHAGVSLREKGKRTEYGPVSWSLILLKGAQAAAQQTIAEKTTRRRVSRGLLAVGGR